jgi:arachidonate 15-lipoxygenase
MNAKIFSPALTDEEKEQRLQYLQRQQEEYKFTYEYLEDLALLKEVPVQENFSADYLAERAIKTAELPANMLATQARSLFDPLDKLEDYDDFFNILRKPDIIKTYQTDTAFAEQRLSGANPLAIRCFETMPKGINIPLKKLIEATVSLFSLGDLSLEQEISEGHILITDYTSLSFVQGGTYEKGHKYLPKPLAFFWWRKQGYSDRGKLVPIAIILDNQPDSKIFTPLDKHLDWFIAKLCVQIADANHHEMSSHLARTHLVMEPFAIATARQLAANHPLGLLLRQHFRFMLTNNYLARKRLINQGGYVDRLLAGTLPESLQITKDAYTSWNLKDFAFPTEIENRGMEDTGKLPHYPYRDDGMLLWEAIHKFVTDYLTVFYPTPEDIQNDQELKNWAQELVSQKGGKVKGMPEQIDSINQLIEIVTTIIFICGPQHSAINYSQYEYLAFVPNMPLAAYQKIPTNKEEIKDEKDLLQFLPPQKRTGDQLELMYILSNYRYDRLGYYDEKFTNIFKNTEIEAIITQFQQDLNQKEIEINSNNKSRIVSYPFLKPSLVLNSISI